MIARPAVLAFAVIAMVASPGGVARAEGGMLGFRPAEAAAQRAREATVAEGFRADTLRRHLRILTESPHVAGTPADRATAEYVKQRLESYGWKAEIQAVPVWLDYPKRTRLELIEPEPRPLAVRERGIPGDQDSFDADALDAFHGYGATGDVTAPVVYANYGDLDDLKKLREMGIDPAGKILLLRYGKVFRGLKVRNAERAGAVGVVIYSDPADDGFMRGDVYPEGPARPADAIQRGSVQFLSEGPGDPTTPGWPSVAGGKRLKPAETRGIPRIPSLPIAWGEAEKILEALGGPGVPSGWQGAIPLPYHVGPGAAKLRLATEHDYAVRPIWNVIATLEGRESRDQWVMCGNHRDAWTYGAIDPNSGTTSMLEMARGIGALAKNGWRPRRTLVLASWDGEEYGLLGSTEWCEAHAKQLGASVVAYLNVDVAVAGRDFRVNGCHALSDVLVEAAHDVSIPGRGMSVFAQWKDRAWSEGKNEWSRRNRERRWRGEAVRPFEIEVSPLGSGSDYTAFVDRFGVPALDLRFEGLQGTYHSMYDDFRYLDHVVDPTYAYHLAITDLWTRVTLRLAEAEVLPFRYSRTARFVMDELQSIEEKLDDANAGVESDSARYRADLAVIRAGAQHLLEAATGVEREADAALESGNVAPASAAAFNASLIAAERGLLGAGLPGRPWFRHEIYAPGLDTGYAPVPLPRLGQSLIERDRAGLNAAAAPIRAALERAAAALKGR